MDRRLQFQQILEDLLGSRNVYFQPTQSVKLQYPAIIYKRDSADITHADNLLYLKKQRYQVTVIDRDPDSDIPEKVQLLPYSIFNRHYTADNLNHDVYNVYY